MGKHSTAIQLGNQDLSLIEDVTCGLADGIAFLTNTQTVSDHWSIFKPSPEEPISGQVYLYAPASHSSTEENDHFHFSYGSRDGLEYAGGNDTIHGFEVGVDYIEVPQPFVGHIGLDEKLILSEIGDFQSFLSEISPPSGSENAVCECITAGGFTLNFGSTADGQSHSITIAQLQHLIGYEYRVENIRPKDVSQTPADHQHNDAIDQASTSMPSPISPSFESNEKTESHHVMHEHRGGFVIEDNNSFLMAMGKDSRIEMYADDAKKASVVYLESNAETGDTELVLSSLDTNWEVGDKISVASTDFDHKQAEVFSITAIHESESHTRVELDRPLENLHWGQEHRYASGNHEDGTRAWTLDMRAEVALLSRNVRIQGDADSRHDGYGGHTMVMHGATQHIDGVEFYQMGQAGELGRYPIHWHMLRDAGAGQYVSNASVHDSYNRGVVVHDTNHVWIENTVVYDTYGHGFYFEDASERHNVLVGNIAFGQKSVSEDQALTVAEREGMDGVSSYWISNPLNHFIDNIAAGSDGMGMWYLGFDSVTGEAALDQLYEGYAPRKEEFGLNRGTVTHSNGQFGFSVGGNINRLLEVPVDDRLDHNDTMRLAHYDNHGNLEQFRIEGLTSYKAEEVLWNKGFGGIYENAIFADTLMTTLRGYQTIQDSLFVGNSPNTGVQPYESVTGIRIYDEAIQVVGSHFAGFDDSDDAFSIQPGITSSSNHIVSDITFDSEVSSTSFIRGFGIQGEGNAQKNSTSDAIYDFDGVFFGEPGVITMVIDGSQRTPSNRKIFPVEPGFNRGVDGKLAPGGEFWLNPLGSNIGNSAFQIPDEKLALQITKLLHGEPEGVLSGIKDQSSLIAYSDPLMVYELVSEQWSSSLRLWTHGFTYGAAVEYVLKDVPTSTVIDQANLVEATSVLAPTLYNTWFWFDADGDGKNNDISLTLVAKNSDLLSMQEDRDLLPSTEFNSSVATVYFDKDYSYLSSDATEQSDVRYVVDQEYEPLPEQHASTSSTIELSPTYTRWFGDDAWRGSIVPSEDTFVVIGPDEIIVLNSSSTVRGIIIDGGALIIEDGIDIELKSDFILVLNGGLFQVGTEMNPHVSDFVLTLEGDDAQFDLPVDDILSGQLPNVAFAQTGGSSLFQVDPGDVVLQSGVLSIGQNGSDGWVQVDFLLPMEDPIVVLGPVSSNDIDSVLASVRNVTGSGFEAKLSEWSYQDNIHEVESVPWIAVEAGRHELDDGSVIQAGSNVIIRHKKIAFEDRFDDQPVVIAQISGNYDEAPVVHRIKKVNDDNFSVTQQHEEVLSKQRLEKSRLDWVAFGDGPSDYFDFGTMLVSDEPQEVPRDAPGDWAMLADMQTMIGTNAADVRLIEGASGRSKVFVEEEQSKDLETNHVEELVGWVAVDSLVIV